MIWKKNLEALPASLLSIVTTKLFSWSAKFELVKLMLKLQKSPVEAQAGISLREWAETTIVDPMVRNLFYMLSRTATYTYDVDHQLAGTALKQVHLAIKSGVIYLDGGWQVIVDQLHEQAKKLGVSFFSNATVKLIESGCTKLKINLIDGDSFEAKSVVSTLAPEDTYRLIGEIDSPTLKRWKDEARRVTGACLNICLKRLPVADRHFVMGLDQPLYYSNHSLLAKLSKDGSQVMHLVKYHEFGDHDPKKDEQILEQMMNKIHQGWQNELIAKQFLPAMTIMRDYPHTGRSDSHPGPVVPEIPQLFVAGDWASHGELLADTAVASARRAVAQILQETR